MSLDDLLRVLPVLGFFAAMVVVQVWLLPRLGVPT
jgi:ABC-type anion transport system duplicated permease subunit